MGRSAPVVKTAKLDPSRLGSVFSPHHPNESQAVDPKLWKPKGRVLCRETQFEFQLPAEIPPLHAKFVPGQFNIVKSPYRDEEVPVDEGEWHSGATFNCPASGEPFVMPPDLPLPEAEVPSSPGIVLSPYVGEEVAISPEHWLPGNQIDCPYCKCPFTLPSNLPEFLAEPQEAVGTFKSPYAPGSVFKLEPHECIPGNTVVCISSKRKLKIPASLPPSWVFSGVFRQGVLPEVKSPFTVESEWKPVPAKDWKQGAQFRCNRTGLTFVVSDPPPVLSVKCGEPAPSIISPFSPHPRLELSKSDWKPDAELTVEFEAGIPCNIRLPIDLPKLLEEPPPPPQPPAQRETPQPPASSHSVGNSRILRTPPTLKPARIDHSRPGVVYSPHGGRNEQLIPPKDWEPKGIIQCAETGQNFVLPLELPAREAIVIAGRYDAVMSPYREFEIPVSGNEWHPGAKVVCPATGRDVVMPEQLPPPLAEVSQRAIGFVVSPYTGEEIEVSPEQWAGGQKIVCPNSQLEFLLPSDLPLLLALPQSKAGEIVSPYEKTKPFEIPAWECKPDKEIACKHTGKPLRLPPTLPSDWQFSGPARQADIPQIRSPFFPKLDQAWQPISASDWRTGATITCEKTGRPFTVSGDLPVLDVKAGAECPQILSPFPPHTPVAISTENWKPGAEVSIKVAENALCKVRLPKELPLPVAELSRSAVGSVISPYTDNEIEIPPAKWVAGQKIHCPHSELEFLLPGELPLLLAILKPKAGTVVSPYEKSKPFELPAWDCKPGKEITCKHTGKALRLPPALPTEWAFTGPVRQAEIPQVHSPFYANTDQAWQPIGAEDWRSGSTIICEKTGRAFLVSGELPILNVKAAPEPLQILSPFPPHSPLTVSSEQWKPGAEISLKLSEKATCTVRLPKDLPLPIAELSNRAVGFVKSPYTGKEIEIPPTHWIDGQKFHCPHSKLDFLLPSALPLLIARPQSKPGEFVSPYETSKPFEIPAWDCKPGKEIVCKHTGKQLRLPPVLPTDWVFAGPVRQADVPQVRSPFCPKLDQAWQAVGPEDWRTGAEIVCEKTGRPFVMAGDLPILNVLAAPEPFQILSPFPPHSPISVARVQWKPEAEIVVSVPEKFSFTVRLPKDLPLPVAKLSPRATGSVISPYTSNEIEISPSDWDRSKRIRCPHSKLEFLLPDELPYLLVIPQSRAGEIISPYEKSKPFDIPAWQCEPNQEISCKHTGKRLRLPPTLPTSWAFFGRTRQGDAPQVQSPFVPNLEDAWQPIPAADWWAGAAITCKKTRKAFLVSDDIPILNVETAAEPLLVLSPFPPHSPISISTDDWKPGAEVSINIAENVACKVRLPDNLPSLGDVDLDDPVFASLPRGKQPKAKGSKGLIQSPFTQKPQPVLGKHWLPGIKLTCVDTGQDFWLPKNLPPLDAVVTDIPGTIISPYSESAISVSPDDWESGKKILCPESDAYIVLPKPLPSLEAILSPDKPGVVFSPYHPTVPVQLSYTDWKVGKQLKCPRSARPIALPDELPEWICDAEVFPKKPLWAREPDGTRITVDVSPNDWVAGGIIKLPTGRRLRLPDSLPPLVAQLVEDGPGYIRSPFADPTYEYNIPRKLWQPGGIISCPATARPLKLPDTLPKLPSSLPKIASIVIVIAVIAAVILTLLKLILRS